MTTVPASPAIGDKISADWGSEVHDALDLLLDPPMFVGEQATAQTIPNATYTALTLDTDVIDTRNGHSTVANTSRYTAVVAGWYDVKGIALFTGAAGGTRKSYVAVNGTALNYTSSSENPSATQAQSTSCFGTVYLAVGDYVEMYASQNTGASLDLVAGYSSLTCRWVSGHAAS